MATSWEMRLIGDGEEQILVLPEGLELPGDVVAFTRMGQGVLIEPLGVDERDHPQPPPRDAGRQEPQNGPE